MMNILYIGPNVSTWALEHRPGDAAAAKWSHGLLKGLSAFANISVLTHVRERCWPKGDVFWRGADARYHPSEWPCKAVSYPCLYKVRDWWLDRFYPCAAEKLLSAGRFDAVLLYNCLEPFKAEIMARAKRLGIPSFPMILDGNDPRRDNWAKIVHDTRDAAGVVFLSYWASKNYPGDKPVLHMDGATPGWNGSIVVHPNDQGELRIKTFVHTGALDKWRGLRFMDSVAKILDKQRPDIKIVLCGKITDEERAHFAGLKNIVYRGFVSEAELADISRNADGFLNVRDPEIGDNILNYPSKIPQYLSWGKPVVSTWIDSFSPDYRAILKVNEDNTPESFARKVCEVADENCASRVENYNRIRDWFKTNKTWPNQAKRLVSWIEEIKRVHD